MKSFLRFWHWHNAQQAPGLPTTCLLRFSLVGSNSQIGANLHQFPRLVLPCPPWGPFPYLPHHPRFNWTSINHPRSLADVRFGWWLTPSLPSEYKCCTLISKLLIWIYFQEEKRREESYGNIPCWFEMCRWQIYLVVWQVPVLALWWIRDQISQICPTSPQLEA